MGIIFPITSMIRLFTFGMAAGMQPIIGYNYGAGHRKRVKETFFHACRVNFFVVLLFVVFIIIFADKVVGLFSRNNPELTSLSTHAIRIFLFMTPIGIINILSARYFQAVGKGSQAIIIGLSGQLFIFLPVLFVLSFLYKLDGIWFSQPLTNILAFVVTSLFIVKEMRFLSAK